ncbi:TrkA family potassium uptake protein [Microbacteriaceae bacterium VKM Ac-2855]|nr:TrkA family potassium uptake protein [Microbacteriaceae bacterium VKM Ac-2855]
MVSKLFGGSGRSQTAAKLARADSVAVIGLGRFGSALALELMELGVDVLGVDERDEVVQSLNGQLTHVVRADTTREAALRQLGVHEFSHVVVAIGTDLEANILTASLVLRMGVLNVWAKAISEHHGIILEQLGVPHVVFPEHDMGKRVAHLVRGSLSEYIELDSEFALITTPAPPSMCGKPLSVIQPKLEYDVTIVAVRSEHGWDYTKADSVIHQDDLILVAGKPKKIEDFAALD